jgi:hypothetical protein
MTDPVLTRLSALESVVFGSFGIPSISPLQLISQTGPSSIIVQPGLVLIVAPGSAILSLPQPSVAQNGLAVSFLSANSAGPWQNVINVSPGGIISPGTPTETFSQMVDNGEPGNVVSLVASGGLWTITRAFLGFGWTGVAGGLS